MTNSLTFSPYFLIFLPQSSTVLFTIQERWRARVCPYIFEQTVTHFQLITPVTSHLLQRLMSVIYHNLIMGLSMSVHACVCVCARVPPYFSSSVSLLCHDNVLSRLHFPPSILIYLFLFLLHTQSSPIFLRPLCVFP